MMRVYAEDNRLRVEGGKVLGTFSGHWPAVAAMIRLHDPAFRSLGTEKPCDLDEEARVRAALSLLERDAPAQETPTIANNEHTSEAKMK